MTTDHHTAPTVCRKAILRDSVESSAFTMATIGSVIWNEALSTLYCTSRTKEDADLENKRIVIRVDCHPRDQTEMICQQIQLAALESTLFSGFDKSTITDPYEGPVDMTASATKCTHRLSVISKHAGDLESGSSYYWGCNERQPPNGSSDGMGDFGTRITDIKLNHQANDDLLIVPSANPSLADICTDTDPTAPLSRAYYKLHQVWQDSFYWPEIHNNNFNIHDWLHGKVGMDVGASPGGWTQVLVHCLKLRQVVALDAGRLAERVLQLPQVVHLPMSVESVLAGHQKEDDTMVMTTMTKTVCYSVLVCDASVRWRTVMNELLLPLVQKVAWTLPSVVVITLKLPFKTSGSIQRQIDGIEECLPTFLEELTAAMYPDKYSMVATRYHLVHLMANTDMERTLIIHCLGD